MHWSATLTDIAQLTGTTLADRYRIEREIGRGGMATVYLANDLKHHRPVAVKILHPLLAANIGADRFLREIEIAGRLSHPHILTLIDSGESNGILFYVMPFVEGESLRQRLNRGPVPIDETVAIGRQVASALAYAHHRGVVHRDIKPENVMLSGGEVIVTDFGIAKAVSSSNETLTQAGTSVGTPTYMSPEQAAGDADVDGRSDIYSLGCVLYELMVGEPPFAGDTPQAQIVKRFTEKPRPMQTLRSDVPPAAEAAVMRALEREPQNRYSTATELSQSLIDAVRGSTPAGMPTATFPVVAATRSIAVLPFTDMSPDRDQEYFADGIAEEIINALNKLQALRVASRTSSFAFKGRNEDIGEIGRKLKVATVLEGSVRKAGNRLRVTSQLVDVADGYQLWSDRYDRDLEDVFAIQDEIASSIVDALRVVINEDEKKAIERPRVENVGAYEYYLRGRQFFHQFREKSLQYARRMFQRAIEIDPGYSRAHAGVADCSSMLYHYWDASDANLEQAESASRRALELMPDLAEAHASRGLALGLSRKFDEAAAAFENAIRLDPKLFEAHYYYGLSRFAEGKLKEAAELFGNAATVRPDDYQALALRASALATIDPDGSIGAMEAVLPIVARHLEINPGDARALYLGAGAAFRAGDRALASDWAERALALDPEDPGVLYNVACSYAIQREPERAVALLEKAVQNGFGHKDWIENDTDLAPLRGHPRYKALMETL